MLLTTTPQTLILLKSLSAPKAVSSASTPTPDKSLYSKRIHSPLECASPAPTFLSTGDPLTFAHLSHLTRIKKLCWRVVGQFPVSALWTAVGKRSYKAGRASCRLPQVWFPREAGRKYCLLSRVRVESIGCCRRYTPKHIGSSSCFLGVFCLLTSNQAMAWNSRDFWTMLSLGCRQRTQTRSAEARIT